MNKHEWKRYNTCYGNLNMHPVVENSLMFNELHESCLWLHFRGKLIENDLFEQYPASAQITIVYSCLTVLCGPGKLKVQINSTL